MEYLTFNQAAEYLGVSTATLRAYAGYSDDRFGLIPEYKRPLLRNSKWSLQQLKKYNEGRKRNRSKNLSPNEEKLLSFEGYQRIMVSMRNLLQEANNSGDKADPGNILEVVRSIYLVGRDKNDIELIGLNRKNVLDKLLEELSEEAKVYKTTFVSEE